MEFVTLTLTLFLRFLCFDRKGNVIPSFCVKKIQLIITLIILCLNLLQIHASLYNRTRWLKCINIFFWSRIGVIFLNVLNLNQLKFLLIANIWVAKYENV